ncbi:GlcNAc-transferase family protein [Brucellaceae bacterium C25G]
MENSSKNTHKTIFISVAAFCDPMLLFTVQSAYENARWPERLAFGIVDQNTSSVEDVMASRNWRFNYLQVPPHQSRGACWARSLAMSFYKGEDYFLQIDSHSLFEPNWDEILINDLETIAGESGNDRIILSTRPFAFEIKQDDTIEKKRFTENTIKLTPKENSIKVSDPVVMFSAINSGSQDNLPGFQISAALLFTRGQFVEDVPYDPFFYFHGEEQNIALRAYTSGWDIWHPNNLPLYHLYKSRAEGEAPLHWDAEFESKRAEKWVTLRARATKRLSDLFMGKLHGVYGCGHSRTIDDYLKMSGMQLVHDVMPRTEYSAFKKPDGQTQPVLENENLKQERNMTTSAKGQTSVQSLPNGATSLNENYQDWLISGAKTDKGVIFVMSQQQRKRDTGQLILAAELSDVTADYIKGTLVLPFGLSIRTGVALQIDDSPVSQPLAFLTALPTGTIVPVSFDSKQVKALCNGKELKIFGKAFDSDNKVLMAVSLKGFDEARSRILSLKKS